MKKSYSRPIMISNLFILFIIILLSSCANTNKTFHVSKIERSIDSLNAINTEFGFKLFSQVSKYKDNQNIVLSPSSVSFALSMLLNGADGETKGEIEKTLGFDGISLEKINETNKKSLDSLKLSNSTAKLIIANSLWSNSKKPLKNDFIEKLKDSYNAQLSSLDFQKPDSIGVINNWVRDITSGKITGIINEISPMDVAYILNAVYFKGEWTNKFETHNTLARDFNLMNGSKIKVPMMTQTDEFNYYNDNTNQAIELPYSNCDISMYIFLPSKIQSLDQFQSNFNYNNWDQIISKLQKREGTITLPKFKVENDNDLNEVLKSMGMKKAFDSSNADFSNASNLDIYISKIKQKSFVDVNEAGTEAAVVTSIAMQDNAIMEVKNTFTMMVDKPFFFTIYDKKTKTILFLGSIVNPK